MEGKYPTHCDISLDPLLIGSKYIMFVAFLGYIVNYELREFHSCSIWMLSFLKKTSNLKTLV